jgi:hypothetical protein
MAAPISSKQDAQNLSGDPGRRRSMRVLLSVPILVSGKTADGKDFKEDARTLVVNAHGALVALDADLATDQEIEVANKATRKSVTCRVVHVGNAQSGKAQMGIEFVKPLPSFWQIDFPPEDWVVPES